MIISLDNEMANLVTELKWLDWTASYTIAVTLNESSEMLCARVIEQDDIDLLYRLEDVRADHWSINDLFTDLLCGVAYGIGMEAPTSSHQYILAILKAITIHEEVEVYIE